MRCRVIGWAAIGGAAIAGCVSSSPTAPDLSVENRRIADQFLREGDQARRDGNLESAEASYRKALQHHPALAEAHYQIGNAYLQRMKQDAVLQYGEVAVREYTATLSLVPTYRNALYNRAVAQYQLAEGRWPELYKMAARDLQRLVEMYPRDSEAHYFLARIFDRRLEGMEADALRHYRKYIELGGRNPEAQERLQALAALVKKPKEPKDQTPK
jgi:Flp pilus assembly protein TadD